MHETALPNARPAGLSLVLRGAWVLGLGVGLLAGCASSSPDVVRRADAQRLSTVSDAVVLSVRPVTVDGSQSGVGAATGGLIGGAAAYGAGGSNPGNAAVVGLLGAAAGAVAGNIVERVGTREDAYEIIVQLAGGERRAIVQAKGEETFKPGDAVLLINSGGKIRVALAPRN